MLSIRGLFYMLLYTVFSLLGIGIVLFLYDYLEKVRKIKNRLKILGVPPQKQKGGLSQLREILYDKEMELSEKSFLVSEENDI